MEYDCGFNTKLLHGKTSKGFSNREILPPISQVTAFRYESMEELETLRRSQHIFRPQRPEADCAADYALWHRAVERSRGWIENEM